MQLFWLIGVGSGFLIIWKSEWLYQNFGTVAWAEEHLGTEGGSRLFYKLFGLVLIFISFLGVSGLLGGMILGIFGGMFKGMVR
ncbi:MAG TPA: hypothetical protein DEB73_01860 [Candidatus Magasanikbacteria bacterium]|uniref:Uncharacterized protein n=2 Tax=Candidatus Magasanikiibacteriota TaxID=1752731 RepID=A0A0G0VD26_9BACT|nr:MAG: hypothetical protein UU49_C0028G0010 [Candidatus Magasanikbacteria bacterium GW2011_GWC2_41_17]HBV57987.1 hypothetical protein [Candidatus Magasanikbacteria bacterium]HBX16329.1 hypothetical protein [Candidatus Magasanikbacteria bacterium]